MSEPVRTCIGCRRVAPAAELVRVSLRDGVPTLSAHGGRGAWLCRSVECFDRADRAGRFGRALRAPWGSDSTTVLRSAFVSAEANVGG